MTMRRFLSKMFHRLKQKGWTKPKCNESKEFYEVKSKNQNLYLKFHVT